MSTHTLTANPIHSVWDRTLPPRLHIAPGDEVDIQCLDASGAQVHPGMTTQQYLAIDRTRIHALTGPIYRWSRTRRRPPDRHPPHPPPRLGMDQPDRGPRLPQ